LRWHPLKANAVSNTACAAQRETIACLVLILTP